MHWSAVDSSKSLKLIQQSLMESFKKQQSQGTLLSNSLYLVKSAYLEVVGPSLLHRGSVLLEIGRKENCIVVSPR